jgi:predicted RNA-binding protein (virulence factor B family)
MATIGKRNILTVLRGSSPGVYLDGGKHGDILLPNRYVPRGVVQGDRLEVFVYKDSEDRLVATTETPRATVGEVTNLRVVSVNRRIGAFLDWGLAKDLLLPFREQTGPVQVGQDVLVRIYLDEKTQRIVATMKVNREIVPTEPTHFRRGDQVEFLVTERTPLGYKVLVEGLHPGLLYHESISVPVTIGQQLKGYVRAARPDGKIDLSLDQAGYRRVAPLALRVVQALQRNGGRLGLDDDSSPESIRKAFGASKKAFKQALGTLYKARRIRMSRPGIELLDNTTWSPGSDAPLSRETNSKRTCPTRGGAATVPPQRGSLRHHTGRHNS